MYRLLRSMLLGCALAGSAWVQTTQAQSPPAASAQEACVRDTEQYRRETEATALAFKTAGQNKATRDEMCKLISALWRAEARWIKYAEDNTERCQISKQSLDQLRNLYVTTSGHRNDLCKR